MLTPAQMELGLSGGQVRPVYLTARDHLWVEMLLEEYERHVGLPRRVLDERLAGPLPAHLPRRRSRAVLAVLDKLLPAVPDRRAEARALRRFVFTQAAQLRGSDPNWRGQVLGRACRRFGLSRAQVQEALYGDVPPNRRLAEPEQRPTVEEVVARANMLVAQSLLMRSHVLSVSLDSQVEAVVRTAKLLRLLCVVREGPSGAGQGSTSRPAEARGPSGAHPLRGGLRLELSGPLSLFRQTLRYGRALASLLPVVVAAPRWSVEALCEIHGRRYRYRVGHWESVLSPTSLPRRFDSKLEERFLRDFQKLAPDWDVLREPRALRAGGQLIFPDFGLVPPGRPESMVLVELVGYWTPGYLHRKLAALRALRRQPFVVCVDESLAVGQDWPEGLAVCFFRRRVDASAVLEEAKRVLAESASR